MPKQNKNKAISLGFPNKLISKKDTRLNKIINQEN